MKTLRVTALLIFLLPTFQAWAQAPESLIPRKVLFGNPERSSPEISPDGRTLGYLAPEQGVLNVWVRTLGKTDDRVITHDRKRGIRNFSWQYDSKNVLYTQDQDGDENWRVYQTNVASTQTKDLTPFAKVRADIVALEPSHPDSILIQLNKRDAKLFDVYRVNLNTGQLALDTENPGDVLSWQADHDLQVRAAQVTTPDGGTLIRVRNNAKSSWRELMKWGPEETLGVIVDFSPDNHALWVITSLEANAARLLAVDLATGKRTVVAQDPQFDVSFLVTQPRTHKLEAVVFLRERRDFQILDPALKADYEALKKLRDADISNISRDLADDRWVVTFEGDDAPIYYYLYERGAKKASVLFSSRPDLEKYTLAKVRPIEYTARDGMLIYGYLTSPAGVDARNLPLVVLPHGGPWGRDAWGYDPYAQWLANRGYAVLQPNFRASTGYGKKYLNAGDRQWAGAMHTDLLDGEEWAVKQGVADRTKICIMGGSYGGYATLAALAFSPDAFSCGVDIVGPSNLNTLLKTIPPYWSTFVAIFHRRMGEDEEFLKSQSPLFKAEQIKAPLLIGQGANDPRVNKAESDQIVAAMRKNHKPVQYYVFPDEGHGFARPQNRMAFNAASEEFLAKYLGGRFEPPSEAERKLLESIKQ
ncbi:MAG: S9 family peptidase [Acidobacteria bacterium]|nr:S9 family peptidase [Acidobacteriota bacterium]MBV8892560.1 S9 family peptidase [Acidobacteriota bacterium]MBV9482632.1 S9 family peptidase [Acidobacteriota bacterium]